MAGRCARDPRRARRLPARSTTIGASGAATCAATPYGRSDLPQAAAPELLAVLRFLRDTPGSEALGISYGAAYLKAVAAASIDRRALRRHRPHGRAAGRPASGSAEPRRRCRRPPGGGRTVRHPHAQFRAQRPHAGVLRRRIVPSRADLTPGAVPRSARIAALGLTRADCIDPALGPVPRAGPRP